MGPGFMHGYGTGWLGGYGWIGMILGLVVNLGVIVGIVLLVVWAVRRMTSGESRPAGGGGQPSAREILQMRYARGEIDRETFRQMLADLD